MERRGFLGIAALALVTGIGGCVSNEDSPSVPEEIVVEDEYLTNDVLEQGLWYHHNESEEPPPHYYSAMFDESAAAEQLTNENDGVEFVRETDFAESYCLVVQTMMQSARWVELQRIERNGDRHTVDVTTKSPAESYGDDAAVHSLVIRITDEEVTEPAEPDVTLDGEQIET